jgi:hypothetical protein
VPSLWVVGSNTVCNMRHQASHLGGTCVVIEANNGFLVIHCSFQAHIFADCLEIRLTMLEEAIVELVQWPWVLLT